MVGKLLKKRTVSWIVWMHKVTIKGQFKNTLLCTLWSTYFYTSKNMLKKNQLLLWKVSVCNKNNWRNESIVLPAHIHNIISNLHLRQTQKRDTDDKRKQAIPEGHKHPDFMKVIKNIHPRLLKGKKKKKKNTHTKNNNKKTYQQLCYPTQTGLRIDLHADADSVVQSGVECVQWRHTLWSSAWRRLFMQAPRALGWFSQFHVPRHFRDYNDGDGGASE